MAPEENVENSFPSPNKAASNAKKSWSAGEIAIACALAPVAVVVGGYVLVGEAANAVLDPVMEGAEKVMDAAGEVVGKAYDKVEAFVEAKMDESEHKIDPSTSELLQGAGQIGYGLFRGGAAISGALGHGLVGFLRRHNNYAAAAQCVQHGLHACVENVKEGSGKFSAEMARRRAKSTDGAST